MRGLAITLFTICELVQNVTAQFRAYAVDGTLVFALDSVYAVPPKGWFASHSAFYKRRFYNGDNGWGSQVYDDRQQIEAPPPTGVGLSDVLENNKDLEGSSLRWKVPPAKSRVFSRSKSISANKPSVFVVLRPIGSTEPDSLVTIHQNKDGSRTASVNVLPPLDILDELVRKQLGAVDKDVGAKEFREKDKDLQGLGAHDSLLAITPDVQSHFDLFVRGKLHNGPGGSPVFDMEPLLKWIISHEDDFVPLSETELAELSDSDSVIDGTTAAPESTAGEHITLTATECDGSDCEQILTEFAEFESTKVEPRPPRPDHLPPEKLVYEEDDHLPELNSDSKNGPVINASNLLLAMRRESLLADGLSH